MGTKLCVLGWIMSFSPYLRSAMGRFPFVVSIPVSIKYSKLGISISGYVPQFWNAFRTLHKGLTKQTYRTVRLIIITLYY